MYEPKIPNFFCCGNVAVSSHLGLANNFRRKIELTAIEIHGYCLQTKTLIT